MAVCRENLQLAQELQKRAHNKKISLKTMLLGRRFGWTANILKPNIIRSCRRNFLGFFNFYTW